VVHGHSAAGGALARLGGLRGGTRRFYTPNAVPRGRVALSMERALARITDVWIAVSASEGELAVSLGVPRDRVAVVPNGIDLNASWPEARDLRAELDVPAGAPLVGSISRLVAQKAPEVFVRAASIIASSDPRPHFLLIGGGPLEAEVRAEIDASALNGRFHLLRHLPNAAAALAQLNVFVLTSRFEGGPYAPLEAMRAGTPVVLTDVIGNRDTVVPDRTGLLVAADDPAATAGAVLRLLDDDGLRLRLTVAARQDLVDRFDVRCMAATIRQLYLGRGTAP
jgi:glycosyltransferase involved in cell wall biosynthesis